MNSHKTIEAAVSTALASYRGRVVVGFSGGLDSSVLLYAAAQALGDSQRLLALHINHGLNARAHEWQRHCQSVGDQLGIGVCIRAVSVASGGSVEGAARQARYAAFEALLGAGDVLLLGHHLDDQAETVLWRLLRGGADHALAGIPSSRRIGAATLLRPLLGFTRSELYAWAAAQKIEWIEDDSNAAIDADRNYLRRAVLPALRERWPDVAQRLARAAQRSDAAALHVHAALDRQLEEAVDASGALAVAPLRAGSSSEPLVRRWLARAGVQGVRGSALKEILHQACAPPDRMPFVAVSDVLGVRRYQDRLYLTEHGSADFSAIEWLLGERLTLPGGCLISTRMPGVVDGAADAGLDATTQRVWVRPRRGGDRLRLPGGRGSRTVKRLLQEARVPPWQRVHYPLLYVGQQLAVVPGIAVDAAFADTSAAAWRVEWQPRPNDAIA